MFLCVCNEVKCAKLDRRMRNNEARAVTWHPSINQRASCTCRRCRWFNWKRCSHYIYMMFNIIVWDIILLLSSLSGYRYDIDNTFVYFTKLNVDMILLIYNKRTYSYFRSYSFPQCRIAIYPIYSPSYVYFLIKLTSSFKRI